MKVKEARYVDDIANGPLHLYEPQPVVPKATTSKETLPNKVSQVEAVGLNEEEMALVIKRFKTALKEHKDYPNKNKSREKRSCFKCGKSSHFIAQYPYNENDQEQEKRGKKEKRKTTGRQWAGCMLARNGIQTALHLTQTTKDLLPSTSPPSSPTNDIHASWLRRRRYIHEILSSTLLLAIRIQMMI
jgi:hypothetical protein